MSPYKPSSAEKEFFTKLDDERLQILRAKIDRERALREKEQMRQAHWMRCPKCGGELKEVLFRAVKVDRCQSCQGVWLDRGELEILAGSGSNFITDIISSFKSR